MQILSLSKFPFKSNDHLEVLPKTVHENPKEFDFKLFFKDLDELNIKR